MHLVHKKDEQNKTYDPLEDADGLLVLSLLFEEVEDDNVGLEPIISKLASAKYTPAHQRYSVFWFCKGIVTLIYLFYINSSCKRLCHTVLRPTYTYICMSIVFD